MGRQGTARHFVVGLGHAQEQSGWLRQSPPTKMPPRKAGLYASNSPSKLRVAAENRRTRGPRPEPGPVTISATPPTDSNVTRTGPVKLVYGAKFPTRVASALNTLTTEPPPPPPGPVMISAL